MTRSIRIVKIGGNVVNNPDALASFLADFVKLPGQKILVHGGGREATRLSAALGIETTMINGRRVTDRETLDVVTMVYAGLVNKRIVAALQALGCDAIGLSGADADVIRATRRPATPVDFGYVGDIDDEDVAESVLAMLLRNGLTPVFCAITHDRQGQLLTAMPIRWRPQWLVPLRAYIRPLSFTALRSRAFSLMPTMTIQSFL